MRNYSDISIRYMKQNKKRTSLTIMGITLATILIFAIGTFILSFRDAMIEDIRQNDGNYEFMINDLKNEEADKIINNAEVKNASIMRKGDNEYKIKGVDKTNVYIHYVNKSYFDNMYTNKVIEGSVPQSSEEIIIDNYTKEKLKAKVGSIITLQTKSGEDKNLKVIGVSESKYYSGINIYSYFDSSKLDKNYKYDVSVNLKSERNKQKIIKKVLSDANIEADRDNLHSNSALLYLTGNGGNEYKSAAIQNIAIFVIVVIMISTIIVIYNSFNISVIERMRYFGILKAIGSTPKQIMKIVFKEGFAMGVIAFPIGCIIGFLSLKIGIKLFIGDTLISFNNFKVVFYPVIILATAVFIAVTIFLSILGPAIKAMKVSAVDAMRNRNEIKLGKLKRRKSRLVSKTFGIEGSIAYKNIRRTPFRFIVTVLALTISIILFNVFYGLIDYGKQSTSQQFSSSAYESHLYKNETGGFSKEEIKNLQDNDFLKNMFTYKTQYIDFVIENKFVNNEYSDKTHNEVDDKTYKDLNYTKFDSAKIVGGGIDSLKIAEKYIVDGKFSEDALKKGGAILIDGKQVRTSDGKLETINATKYKVGDMVKILKKNNYDEDMNDEEKDVTPEEQNRKRKDEISSAIKNGEFYELPIIAIANKDPFNGRDADGIEIIVNDDTTNSLIGNSNPTAIYFNYDNDKDREKAVDYFENIKTSKNYNFDDVKASIYDQEKIERQIEFFVYCFIIVISIISIVNIFNTISTNLLLRKKEFSTLKAIGMTEKQLKKSVILEGTLYGIIAAILGGGVSAILLEVLIKIGGGLAEVKYKFPFVPFILSIVCTVLITYISTVAPLKRIKKLTIVEGISDEE